MKEVSENIKRLRELKNISREFMAQKLGLSTSGYAKLERGDTEITLNKLYMIANVLETDIAKILNFDVNNVFNISHNELVQGTGAEQVHLHNHLSSHTEKYIALLEAENTRLKSLLEKSKKQ